MKNTVKAFLLNIVLLRMVIVKQSFTCFYLYKVILRVKIELMTCFSQVDACGKIQSHVGKSLNYMELIPDREKHAGLLKALKEFDANNDGILEGEGKIELGSRFQKSFASPDCFSTYLAPDVTD